MGEMGGKWGERGGNGGKGGAKGGLCLCLWLCLPMSSRRVAASPAEPFTHSTCAEKALWCRQVQAPAYGSAGKCEG